MKLRVLTLRPAACLLLWGLVATRLQTTPACGPGVGKPCFKVDRQGGELPTIGVIGLFSWLFPKDESPSNFPNPTAVRIKSWSQHSQSWIGKGVRDAADCSVRGLCVSVHPFQNGSAPPPELHLVQEHVLFTVPPAFCWRGGRLSYGTR